MEEEKTNSENRIKKNPWMISTAVLGIIIVLTLLIIILNLNGFNIAGNILTGNVISSDVAGQKLIDFAKSRGADAELVSVNDAGSLYEVIISIDGEEVPLYVTKDGEYFVQGAIPLSTLENSEVEETPKEVPKSGKPVVEAFIFSYCPYGTQFEKALIPVYSLFKYKADFNIVAIGAMHGEFEKTETLRQISIEKLYNKDKLFAYLKLFDENANIGTCSGDAACIDKYLTVIYAQLSIDKKKIGDYMKGDALKIYEEQGKRASSLGISGSPTFVINGVEVQVSRNPDAIKTAVCSAFNTAPAECSNVISKISPSPGFGTSSASSSSTASCN